MQCILVDHPTLGFERILKQITHIGISIILKSARLGHRPECIICIAFTKTSVTSINAVRYAW